MHKPKTQVFNVANDFKHALVNSISTERLQHIERRLQHIGRDLDRGYYEDHEDFVFRGDRFNNKPIIVNGDLALRPKYSPGIEDLTILPENITVNGLITLEGCTNLESLPLSLKVSGDVILRGCTKLTHLHSNTYRGNLDLANCVGITELPEGLKVEGNLRLDDSSVEMLPQDMQVGGRLSLCNLDQIKCIPAGVKKLGELYLSNCPQFESLPEGLEIGEEGLYITDCPALKSLPKGLSVEGKIAIENTPIRSFPENMTVYGELYLRDFDVWELPRGMSIGGDLFGGYKLNWLPDDLKVKGDICLTGCSGLKELPDWMFELEEYPEEYRQQQADPEKKYRGIYLIYTGIPFETAQRLRNAYSHKHFIKLFLPDYDYDSPHMYVPGEALLRAPEYQEYIRILELPQGEQPTQQAIKKAYRKLSLIYHPDKTKNEQREMFIKITQAKEKLLAVV